jgi:hypothetical protein
VPRALALVACLVPCLVGPARASAATLLAEEVVAVVDKRPVLLTELEFEARLERARSIGLASIGAGLSAAELRAALDRYVDLLVVYAEAERLQVFDLAPGETDRELEAMRTAMGARFDAFLDAWGMDERALAESFRRRLRASRYLESRFRLAAKPREVDVRAHYRRHPEDCRAGESYEACAPSLRALLAKQRLAALTASFVADVRRRARVQVLRDFDRPGSEMPKSGHVVAPQSRGEASR